MMRADALAGLVKHCSTALSVLQSMAVVALSGVRYTSHGHPSPALAVQLLSLALTYYATVHATSCSSVSL